MCAWGVNSSYFHKKCAKNLMMAIYISTNNMFHLDDRRTSHLCGFSLSAEAWAIRGVIFLMRSLISSHDYTGRHFEIIKLTMSKVPWLRWSTSACKVLKSGYCCYSCKYIFSIPQTDSVREIFKNVFFWSPSANGGDFQLISLSMLKK